ncbi:MAG: cell division protein ZapA, partial [Clostridiales bacterium]|nr:cell division protein ZapA [Clostridiales bacterium]
TIITEDDTEYMEELGVTIDDEIKKVTMENPRLSLTQAALLVALDFADQSKKATASADNLRSQIKDYLEDSARARMEVDVARREIERLNRELSSLRMKLSEKK